MMELSDAALEAMARAIMKVVDANRGGFAKDMAEAMEPHREAARAAWEASPGPNIAKLLAEVLKRDARWAPSGMPNDCNCINLSRDAEREYETGECPHQRARLALSSLGSKT